MDAVVSVVDALRDRVVRLQDVMQSNKDGRFLLRTIHASIVGLSGFFSPPTVLVDIPDEAPASREELFGPVALVFRVPDVGIGFGNEIVVSDPHVPFGGVKHSGTGPALGALDVREITNPKVARRARLPESPQ